jgi:hypothetical protein
MQWWLVIQYSVTLPTRHGPETIDFEETVHLTFARYVGERFACNAAQLHLYSLRRPGGNSPGGSQWSDRVSVRHRACLPFDTPQPGPYV